MLRRRPPPCPPGFNEAFGKRKLEEFVKRKLLPDDYAAIIGPQFQIERGWYINIVLDDGEYTDYFVFPDGRVTT